LQSEILDMKADPSIAAAGVVVESRLDKGRGPVSTVLIVKGTLKKEICSLVVLLMEK